MNVDDENHELRFTDGPLEGKAYHLTGVVPFCHFQIGGDMETPLFHCYVLDPHHSNTGAPDTPVLYKFVRTYTFEEFARLIPMPPEDERPAASA